jgi:hypothetical protein
LHSRSISYALSNTRTSTSSRPKVLILKDRYGIKIVKATAVQKPVVTLLPISVYPHRRKLSISLSTKMPIPTADQAKAVASKKAPGKSVVKWVSAATTTLTTIFSGTGGSSNPPTATASEPVGPLTHTVANPILDAARLDGIKSHHFFAGGRMSRFITAPCAQAVHLFHNLTRYRGSIIRNPNDQFDGNLPNFFAPVRSVRTRQRGREMTGAELEEAGFAYGEDLEVLEMQGKKLMGWVADVEDDEETEAIEALWGA